MTRTCSKCLRRKRLEEFPRRPDRSDGRGTICLGCGREYRRRHYARNVTYYLRKAASARARTSTRNYHNVIAYLRAHACVDCGERDVRVLQFDHLDPATKRKDVSILLQRHSWEIALREIEKCDVRCGNCHRRRTRQQRRAGEIRETRRLDANRRPVELSVGR